MGYSGISPPMCSPVKNHFHHHNNNKNNNNNKKLLCDITLCELKMKEFRGETNVQKHWGFKSNQSSIMICNSIEKMFVVD